MCNVHQEADSLSCDDNDVTHGHKLSLTIHPREPVHPFDPVLLASVGQLIEPESVEGEREVPMFIQFCVLFLARRKREENPPLCQPDTLLPKIIEKFML